MVSAYCGSTSKKPVLWDEQNRYDTKANRAGRWADGLIFDRLLLPAMPAYLLFRIPSGKLTASLRKLPIPAKAMLVLVVMLRFAPTIILEFGEVREAMKIRGFLRSVPTVLRHPLNTLEYAIVPMVFRSLKIADELSASAIVRGIESPYKKQSYYVSRISPLDAFLMLVSTAAGIVCCVLL